MSYDKDVEVLQSMIRKIECRDYTKSGEERKQALTRSIEAMKAMDKAVLPERKERIGKIKEVLRYRTGLLQHDFYDIEGKVIEIFAKLIQEKKTAIEFATKWKSDYGNKLQRVLDAEAKIAELEAVINGLRSKPSEQSEQEG